VGFLASLGICVLSGISGIIVLGFTAYFGWPGLLGSTGTITVPCLLVLRIREKRRGEFDDKIGWTRQVEAIERYVREVKRQEC
jgi:hypothetical protein